MTAGLSINSVARSHIGAVRKINEDRILNLSGSGLWAVADGMGGHAMGDIAAQIVVTTLADFTTAGSGICNVPAALAEANLRVHDMGVHSARQCGSTVAVLAIAGDKAHIFWAGDSRVYRYRAGELVLLTRDHRLVQDLIEAGVIDAAAGKNHPQSTVITRAIGASITLDLAAVTEDIAEGDAYLICSDGLSDMVEDAVIAAAFADTNESIAPRLVNAALDAGGTDNISLVIVHIASHGDQSENPLLALGTSF